MKKRIRYLAGIIVLTSIAIVTLIIGAALFATALRVIKEGGGGGAIGGLFILVLFFICIIISAILSLVDLPFTIVSVKKSDNKIFPIIALVIEAIIIAIAITLVILVLINNRK